MLRNQVLTETDKYWINVSDDLYFFQDQKRFLWSSERSGFRHYYIYDFSGKQLEQLTSGDWAIASTGGFGPGGSTHPAMWTKANGYIYFLSNKDDVPETQLYRVSLRDKKHHAAHAGGRNSSPSSRSGLFRLRGHLFDCRDARAPGSLSIRTGRAWRSWTKTKPTELAEYHLSPVEFLNVAADDGTKLYALMIKPPTFDRSKKYPVLIHVYGGPQAQVVRDDWGGGDFLLHEMMAQKGYIIFSLDNRGSYGRGHAFETPVYHQFGKVELDDQLAGVKYLKSLPYVDSARIGIWGWSYGGYMTLFSLFNAPDVFKAGVAVAPVSDWRLYDTIYTERYMGRPQDNTDGYKNSSPVNQAEELKGKLMLAHGTGDDNVHFANSSEVINQLIENGRYPSDLMIFPGRGHPIVDPPARIQLFEGIVEFLEKNL